MNKTIKAMKMKGILVVGISLVSILMFNSCNTKTEGAVVQTEDPAVKVQAVSAKMQDIDQLGTFTGTVEAEITNNIAPQMSARIKGVFVEVGDRVVKGQKLAEMDALNLNQTKLQMENDKKEFERVDELYKVGGISKSNWDARKLAYDVSKESYDNLVENTFLLSPISGIVTQRNYDKGDMYSPGKPLFVVEQINPVKLVVNVSEALFSKVKKGMEIELAFDVYSGEQFKGNVKLVYPTIDPATRTFPVEIQIANSNERIRPGMFARATFNYGTERRVAISDRAIQKQAGAADRYVYVCKGDKAEYRKVELGRRIDDVYEVLSGINEGELVAVTGQSRLNDGIRIEVVNQ